MANKPGRLYRIVKNLLHNDMKVTKSDVTQMIHDIAVKRVEQIVTVGMVQSAVDKSVESLLKQSLSEGGHLGWSFRERVSRMVSDEVGKFVAGRLAIDIKVDGQSADIDKKFDGNGTKFYT